MGLLWSGIVQGTSHKYMSTLCLGHCGTARSWKWMFPNIRSVHQWCSEAGILPTVEVHVVVGLGESWSMVMTQTQIPLCQNACLDPKFCFSALLKHESYPWKRDLTLNFPYMCRVSWTVAWFRFMPRSNTSESQWPTFCGSNSFPLQPLPNVVWTEAIPVFSLPAIPVCLRISPNMPLASPLSPKKKFLYEGSRGQWWHTYQTWPHCNKLMLTLAAAQPAQPSLVRNLVVVWASAWAIQ